MQHSAWLDDDIKRRELRQIYYLLQRFRGQDGEMPVQQMLVFCWVALNEGGLQRDLCASLEMANSTASRNIAALSEVHRLGKPGLGLITWVESNVDRRSKLLILTQKGKAFAQELLTKP